jgi:hypothetical protein
MHARTRRAEGKPGEDAEREKRDTISEKERERERKRERDTRLDLGRRDAREANTAGIGIFSVVDRTVH